MALGKDLQNWHTIGKKVEKTQTTKVKNESGIVTIFTKIKMTAREHYEQLYANKLDDLDEIYKFLETHNLLRLNPK